MGFQDISEVDYKGDGDINKNKLRKEYSFREKKFLLQVLVDGIFIWVLYMYGKDK